MDAMKAVEKYLEELGGCAICFSGGLDSTVLADVAHHVLGDRAIAVTVDVPMMTERQRNAARIVAGSIGIRTLTAEVSIEELAGILENRHDRCYICKSVMYRKVKEIAESEGMSAVVNGEIVDDLSEDRPGMAAGKEKGILTPFIDCGIHRADIVAYLDGMDLPLKLVKDTCMLMRYPEGIPVTEADLRLVEDLEAEVRRRTGLEQLRVRRRGDSFDVQTSTRELPVLTNSSEILDDVFGSRCLRYSINPTGYDK